MGLMFNLFAGGAAKAAKAARAGEHLAGLNSIVREGAEHAVPVIERGTGHASAGTQMDLFGGADIATPKPSYTPPYRKQNGQFASSAGTGPIPKSAAEVLGTETKQMSQPGLFENLDRYISEEHTNPWKRGASIAFNGATMGFSKNIASRIGASSVGAGIAGGIVGGVGAALFPNNIEYQGTVAPILKGAVAGIAIGAAHGAAGRLIQKYKPGEFMHDFANKTQSITGNWKTGGLIAGAVAMGTTNTNFTNPINRVQGI